jgi:hypothetical protein
LVAKGQLTVEEWVDGEMARLRSGGDADPDALDPLQDAIAALLAEAAAYRAYFRRAEIDSLLRLG